MLREGIALRLGLTANAVRKATSVDSRENGVPHGAMVSLKLRRTRGRGKNHQR